MIASSLLEPGPLTREAMLDAVGLAAHSCSLTGRPRNEQLLPCAPAVLLTSVIVKGTTAFLIILAMTLGLIQLRRLFEHFLPAPE